MYKDKTKQREATRKAVQKHRVLHQGITKPEGITKGITPDIIDKLTDSFWRGRLEKICQSFKSRNPHDLQVCWLGDTNLSTACDWLECTGYTQSHS